MKARPILFSVEMIRALLAGRKTMTRRVVKLPLKDRDFGCELAGNEIGPAEASRLCPYGRPGDLLWAREKWRIGAWSEAGGQIAVDYCDGADRSWKSVYPDDSGEKFNALWRQSSDELRTAGVEPGIDGNYRWPPGESPLRWRPSIHMPRWASRITLLIEDVRVERLQGISESDAMAEGAEPVLVPPDGGSCPHRQGFLELWESLHGSDSWPANPFVWRIQFRPILQNVDAYMREAA